MSQIFRLGNTLRRDPRIEAWFSGPLDPFRLMLRPWFERIRGLGPDVREIFHDNCPVACLGDAAFAYVNAFQAHASIGFFQGASLPDPGGLLEGEGKRMRHVKLRSGAVPQDQALDALIAAAYADIRRRLDHVT